MTDVWICIYFGKGESAEPQPTLFKKIDAQYIPRVGEWLNVNDDDFLVESNYHDLSGAVQRITLHCGDIPLQFMKNYTMDEGWLDKIPE